MAEKTDQIAAPPSPAATPQEGGATPASPSTSAAPPADVSVASPAPQAGGDAPALAGSPAAAAAESAPPSAAADAPKEPERTPTLLEKFDADKKAAEDKAAADKAAAEKKPDAKPADAKPDAAKPEGEKATEAKPAEPAAPAPGAYEFKLPETLSMNDEQRTKFGAALDAFRADPAKGAQAIVDIGAGMMTTYATNLQKQMTQRQFDVFNDTKKGWEKQIIADTEIGGSGHQTAMQAAARVRDLGVSSARPGTPRYEQEMKEFNEFLAVTGAGSHPAFVRLLHNLARWVDEPQFSNQPANIKPPPSNGRPPGNRRAALYDHPSSQTRS